MRKILLFAMMLCTLIGVSTAMAASVPDKVYVIGDHNDWKTPTVDNDNGAYTLLLNQNLYDQTGLAYYYLGGSYDAPGKKLAKGDHEFLFYYDNEGEDVFAGIGPQGVPFTLYNYDKIDSTSIFVWDVNTAYKREFVDPFILKDWEGGDAELWIFYDLNERSGQFFGKNCKYRELPPYYVVNNAAENRNMINMQGTGYRGTAFFEAENKCTIFATTEESYNPAPENVYGIPEDVTISGDSWRTYQLVKGGKPINFEFEWGGNVRLQYNWNSSIVTIESHAFLEPVDFSGTEQLYINGQLTGWMTPIEENRERFDADYKLKKVAPGVFEGTFDMPADNGDNYPTTQFRFFTELKGWSKDYSVGSYKADFYCYNVEWYDNRYKGDVIPLGLGNWGLPRWPGGEVRIRVDLNDNTIELVDIQGASIEAVTVSPDDKDATYFNLMGQKVVNPANGLYIRVSKQGVEKVLRH